MTEKEQTQPDWPAVSLAFGPVPAIYVPPSLEQPSDRDQHVSIGGTMTDIPASLRYSNDHLWTRSGTDAGVVRVGVTEFAQQSLGDVVDVTLPNPGDTIKAGEACGEIESVKSVSDLVAPVTGTVRTSNGDLAGSPDLVNSDPYGQGWMFEVEIDQATLDGQLSALMDASAYGTLVGA